MSWKDFFFWLITWFLTISASVIVGFTCVLTSENLFDGVIEDIFIYASIPISILCAVVVQPRLKKMFGYRTGLDK